MKKIVAVCMLGAVIVLAGCQVRNVEEKYSKTVFAMDTVMELYTYGNEQVLEESEKIIQDIENKVSVTNKSSEIYKLNKSKEQKVSATTFDLLEKAFTICEKTNGAMDISIYPIVKAWGFTTDSPRVPEKKEIDTLLKNVNYKNVELLNKNTVKLESDTEIDLGSIAKGYTGDLLLSYYKENGVKSAMINLGGNVQVLGSKPDGSGWSIGIQNPEQDGNLGTVTVVDRAVITSGGYERNFESSGEKYHHIIDTKTGYPANNGILSVTVIGKQGYVCDALSTALFVMGIDKGIEYWKQNQDFEAIWYTDDEKIYITEGIKSSFTVSEDQGENNLTIVSKN